MKSAESLKHRLGQNMAESMGDATAGTGALPAGFATPNGRYAGCTRIKDALAIELGRIVPDPSQPRKEFDEEGLGELAASLKDRGQLQPARVRYDESLAKWILIAGERRYRAAVLAGLKTLACVEARGDQTPDEILTDQLVENCLREDLKPIEQANAYKALMDRRGWSYRELAEFLHISKGTISKAVSLLTLPEPVQELVEEGTLAPHTAYEVSRLSDASEQVTMAVRIVEKGLTAEDAAQAVKARRLGVRGPEAEAKNPSRPIQVEVRPGIVAIVRGVTTKAEAVEVLRQAAALLKKRARDEAA
jgi:ParB family transcriptional regulator, chromosome partitioning protein